MRAGAPVSLCGQNIIVSIADFYFDYFAYLSALKVGTTTLSVQNVVSKPSWETGNWGGSLRCGEEAIPQEATGGSCDSAQGCQQRWGEEREGKYTVAKRR